jgi:hypothetical protein
VVRAKSCSNPSRASPRTLFSSLLSLSSPCMVTRLAYGVRVVLPWCQSGVAVVSELCYSGVRVVSKWCYSGVRLACCSSHFCVAWAAVRLRPSLLKNVVYSCEYLIVNGDYAIKTVTNLFANLARSSALEVVSCSRLRR